MAEFQFMLLGGGGPEAGTLASTTPISRDRLVFTTGLSGDSAFSSQGGVLTGSGEGAQLPSAQVGVCAC